MKNLSSLLNSKHNIFSFIPEIDFCLETETTASYVLVWSLNLSFLSKWMTEISFKNDKLTIYYYDEIKEFKDDVIIILKN